MYILPLIEWLLFNVTDDMVDVVEEMDNSFSRGGGGGGGGTKGVNGVDGVDGVDGVVGVSSIISSFTCGGGGWISTTCVSSLDFGFLSLISDLSIDDSFLSSLVS